MSKICNAKDVFKDVIKAWAGYNFHKPTSVIQITNQVLWYNSWIHEKNQPLFIKTMYQRGIYKISQLLENNNIKPFYKLYQEFGPGFDFLDYFRVVKAIPKEWLRVIQVNVKTEVEKSGIEKVKAKSNVKISKIIYDDLRRQIVVVNKPKLKWENLTSHKFSEREWCQLYKETCKLTLCTKLRFFQYRIINGYLVTNVKLKQWKIIPSELCSFCKKEAETVLHLFVECEKVKKIWKTVERWVHHFCFLGFTHDTYEIIFNKYKDSFPDLINSLLLLGKYFIYVRRCLKEDLNFNAFISMVVKYKKIELISVKNLGKYAKYEYKWCLFDMI